MIVSDDCQEGLFFWLIYVFQFNRGCQGRAIA
jgi:hypothetical protein